MDFSGLDALVEKIRNTPKENIQTEEATKMAFIAPFLNLLGYDVFDPSTSFNLVYGNCICCV